MAEPTNGNDEIAACILHVITERYLIHGCGSSIAEIAQASGWSESTVRKIMYSDRGVFGVYFQSETKRGTRAHDPNLPASGTYRVAVWRPTLNHLRDVILHERKRNVR